MDFASITTGKFALNASMPALYVATSTPEDAATDGHVNPEPTGSHIRNGSRRGHYAVTGPGSNPQHIFLVRLKAFRVGCSRFDSELDDSRTCLSLSEGSLGASYMQVPCGLLIRMMRTHIVIPAQA